MIRRFSFFNIFTQICLSVLLFNSFLLAQTPIFFSNTFNTAPTTASTQTANTWYPDRFSPGVFEQYNLSGENVLHVGIRLADAYLNRPLADQRSFCNTQGRKFDLGSGNSFKTALTADIFIGADWNTKHRMATVWSTANDVTDAVSYFNIFGFRNITGSNPGFYIYDANTGLYSLAPYSITYGQWYSLKIELTDTAFVYSINGTVVLSDTSLSGTKYFSNMMLQSYNFADATLAAESQAFEEYDVYWDNVGAVSTLPQFSNPVSVTLGTAGNYRALAGTGLSIGALYTVNGNVGGATVSNLGTVTGTTDIANAAVTTAQNDLTSAISNIQSRTADSLFAVVDLGGMVLGRGVYVGTGTLSITGTLTLFGTASDIFIIRTGSPGTSLITSASSIVNLTGGVLSSNVFWQTGTTTTIGASSDFKGTILAGTAIMQNASSFLVGSALSLTTVTLNGESALPVELVSFTGVSNQSTVNLKWSTATEVNNYGFEIQRSAVNSQISDKNWMKRGFVEGAGTTNSPKEYSYADNNLSSGKYSYRLKQIDRNGKFEYSKSVEVTVGQVVKEFALMQNYPNPFNPSTMISYQIPVNSSVSLKVYDAIGREIATLVNEAKEAGSYSVQFNASHLSAGIYFYTIKSGSFTATKKLTLLK